MLKMENITHNINGASIMPTILSTWAGAGLLEPGLLSLNKARIQELELLAILCQNIQGCYIRVKRQQNDIIDIVCLILKCSNALPLEYLIQLKLV